MQDDSDGPTASQIGDLGEMAFKALCLQQGLHCSTIDPDRTGKDFLVEWPPGSSGGHSYDTRHPPRRCIVQVKATASEIPRVRLKLSAAEWPVSSNSLRSEYSRNNEYSVKCQNSLYRE